MCKFLGWMYGWIPVLPYKPGWAGCPFSKASGASVILALFNGLHAGGQGFGRRLPLGGCVLFGVMQAASFSNQFLKSASRLQKGGGEVQRRGPRSRTLLWRLLKGTCRDARGAGAGSGCCCFCCCSSCPKGSFTGRTVGQPPAWGQQRRGWSLPPSGGVSSSVLCLGGELLQETATLLHPVETCPSFSPLLWLSYQTNGIFLAPVQGASFSVGSEPNALLPVIAIRELHFRNYYYFFNTSTVQIIFLNNLFKLLTP